MFKLIDRWIDKVENRLNPSTIHSEKYILACIDALAFTNKPLNVVLTGTVSEEVLKQVKELLHKAAVDMGISGLVFEITKDASSIVKKQNQSILLVEEKRKSITSEVNEEINFLCNTDQEILGLILV